MSGLPVTVSLSNAASRPAGRVTAHLVLNFIADFDDEQ